MSIISTSALLPLDSLAGCASAAAFPEPFACAGAACEPQHRSESAHEESSPDPVFNSLSAQLALRLSAGLAESLPLDMKQEFLASSIILGASATAQGGMP